MGKGCVSQCDVERGQGFLLLAEGASMRNPLAICGEEPWAWGAGLSLPPHAAGKAQTCWAKGGRGRGKSTHGVNYLHILNNSFKY